MIALCDYYYGLKVDNELSVLNETVVDEEIAATYFVYQCKNCLTIYDQFWGNELNGIAAGTDFLTLADYQCPTCEAPKTDFWLWKNRHQIWLALINVR